MKLRRFISLLATFSFLIMTYTGIMLFITPKGRIANWSNWELWGLSKDQYGALHVTFMVLFLAVMVVHLWLNWSPLMSYLKNKNHTFSLFSKEFGFALCFTLVFFIGTLTKITPFQTFLDFQEAIKTSWEKGDNEPPYGHAELSSLKTFSKRIGQDVDKAMLLLEAKGFQGIHANAKLLDIATLNKVSPNTIYTLIDPMIEEGLESKKSTQPRSVDVTKATTVTYPKEGSGLGRMSLEEVCKTYGTDLNKAIRVLQEKGVNATKDSRMRQCAQQLGTTPYDLFEMFL